MNLINTLFLSVLSLVKNAEEKPEKQEGGKQWILMILFVG